MPLTPSSKRVRATQRTKASDLKPVRHLGLLVSLAAIAAAGIAGCGGGGGSDEAAPTKADYVTKANAICGKSNDALSTKATTTFGTKKPSGEEINSFTTDVIVPTLQTQLKALEALPKPESDVDSPDDVYSAFQTVIDDLTDDPSSSTDDQTFAHASQLATDYGLTECATA
jgi:hypothetical protein